MERLQRISSYQNFQIIQTLTEDKREGDYNLVTEVVDIKFSEFKSFAWLTKVQKIQLITDGLIKAQMAIDSHLKTKDNPYIELGFEPF